MKKAKNAERRLMVQKKRLEKILSSPEFSSDHPKRIVAIRLLGQVTVALQSRRRVIEHLEKEKFLQIGGRLVGVAAPVVNIGVPGLGTVVSTAVTAVVLQQQEASAAELPSESPAAQEARNNTRWNTVTSTACVVSGLAFGALSYLVKSYY